MMNYKKDELVKIAKRENNTKRPYLLVNPLQGKHIPVSPKNALCLFKELSDKLSQTYPSEKFLIIGFAETATAIGAAVALAENLDGFYIHTTRESLPDTEYLYFSESHSHASEQRLVKNNLEKMIRSADRIIFAEDEVTTGNTILHLIHCLKEEYPDIPMKFGILSILNAIPHETAARLKSLGIECTYILPLESADYNSYLEQFHFEPETESNNFSIDMPVFPVRYISGKADPRYGIEKKKYLNKCREFAASILRQEPIEMLSQKKILVLGTEEFMFPALYFANLLESCCAESTVKFHATTRSPILPCRESGYPLSSRYQLESFYESQRTTFLYNLEYYDKVFILSDTETSDTEGIENLLAALHRNNCRDICVYIWRY